MTYLLTWMGTVLCQDPATRQLVHRPLRDLNGTSDLIELRPAPTESDRSEGKPTMVPVRISKREKTAYIHLSDGNLFLCAEPDGSASFSRQRASGWESLLPVEADDLEALRFITENRWVHTSTGRICAAALRADGTLRIGALTFALEGNVPLPFARGAGQPGKVRGFSIFRDGWKLEDFVLFRPLIIFVAFKSDAIFAMLELALKSLHAIGRYEGELLIITDRTIEQLEPIIPPGIRSRTHLWAREASGEMDFYASRYWVVDWPGALDFQPVLYLDTDVIVDRPVGDVLSMLVLSKTLSAQQEKFSLLQFYRLFCTSLFAEDRTVVECRFGFN